MPELQTALRRATSSWHVLVRHHQIRPRRRPSVHRNARRCPDGGHPWPTPWVAARLYPPGAASSRSASSSRWPRPPRGSSSWSAASWLASGPARSACSCPCSRPRRPPTPSSPLPPPVDPRRPGVHLPALHHAGRLPRRVPPLRHVHAPDGQLVLAAGRWTCSERRGCRTGISLGIMLQAFQRPAGASYFFYYGAASDSSSCARPPTGFDQAADRRSLQTIFNSGTAGRRARAAGAGAGELKRDGLTTGRARSTRRWFDRAPWGRAVTTSLSW